MGRPIYLDYAATTPVDPRVAEVMAGHLGPQGVFGNPSSRSHLYGRRAEAAVERARAQVAALLNCDAGEILWTSGATESNNLVIKGLARAGGRREGHLVTCATEHRAVLEPCRGLERQGYRVTYLAPASDGTVSARQLEQALTSDTFLVSIAQVNSETGVTQDLDALGAVARAHGVPLHSDAAQGVGKLPLDLSRVPVDLVSISAHKVYGPKGAGALYLRSASGLSLEPLIHGGGQERGMRSGTVATHQVVGLGEALRLAGADLLAEAERVRDLRGRLWRGIAEVPGVWLNGDAALRAPGILNVSFEGIEAEALITAVPDLAVSSGSACSSGSGEASHVLRALGRSEALARAAIRYSLGRFTTAAEVDEAIRLTVENVARLRARAAGAPVRAAP